MSSGVDDTTFQSPPVKITTLRNTHLRVNHLYDASPTVMISGWGTEAYGVTAS